MFDAYMLGNTTAVCQLTGVFFSLLTSLILGDELFTDASKVKLIDGCIWEVECKVR